MRRQIVSTIYKNTNIKSCASVILNPRGKRDVSAVSIGGEHGQCHVLTWGVSAINKIPVPPVP